MVLSLLLFAPEFFLLKDGENGEAARKKAFIYDFLLSFPLSATEFSRPRSTEGRWPLNSSTTKTILLMLT